MELFLIRHAQSINNARPEQLRVEDPGLTETGHQQAELLGRWIGHLELDKFIVSPFLRTLETAQRLYQATGVATEVRSHLHELGGCYKGHIPEKIVGRPGMSRSQIKARFPDFVVGDGIDEQGWWKHSHRETWHEATERARTLFKQTMDEFTDRRDRIAYVMHADIKTLMINTFHTDQLETPLNTSVSQISVLTDQVPKLVRYNLTEHLHDGIVTS